MNPRPSSHQSSRSPGAGRFVCGVTCLVTVVSLFVVGLLARSFAQDQEQPVVEQPTLGQVKNFAVPDYYDPPNQDQMKSLLRGAEAQPQPNGRVLIKDLQLETYNTNGSTAMIVRAPDCTYDQINQTATSSNRIEASSGDGKLHIEGEGFRWEQAGSMFTISNSVHTTIRRELDNAVLQ